MIQESLLKSNHRFQIPVLTNIFLTVDVTLFVNFFNVAVVHMGFFYKERKRERQNIFFLCQSKRSRLIPTTINVRLSHGTDSQKHGKKAVDCLWLVRNIISTQILKKAQILKKLPAHPKIIKSCRPAFGFDLIPS